MQELQEPLESWHLVPPMQLVWPRPLPCAENYGWHFDRDLFLKSMDSMATWEWRLEMQVQGRHTLNHTLLGVQCCSMGFLENYKWIKWWMWFSHAGKNQGKHGYAGGTSNCKNGSSKVPGRPSSDSDFRLWLHATSSPCEENGVFQFSYGYPSKIRSV